MRAALVGALACVLAVAAMMASLRGFERAFAPPLPDGEIVIGEPEALVHPANGTPFCTIPSPPAPLNRTPRDVERIA